MDSQPESYIRERLHAYHDPVDGVYIYLPVTLDKVKRIDAETYSYRAAHFETERILTGGFSEMALFKPIIERGTNDRLYLETGGGDGRFALELMRKGYRVVETDIAEGSVRKAREFAVKAGVADQNYFMVADAENLPFKDDVFDGVFMVASLHHVPRPELALREIFRVTKPGGCVLVLREPASWFNYAFWPVIKALRFLVRKRNPGEPKSLADDVTMGFSRRRLKSLFHQAGFVNVKIAPVDYAKKFYANVLVVMSRVLRRPVNPNFALLRFFGALDKVIAKIPLLNALAWDWDSWMEKPRNEKFQ